MPVQCCADLHLFIYSTVAFVHTIPATPVSHPSRTEFVGSQHKKVPFIISPMDQGKIYITIIQIHILSCSFLTVCTQGPNPNLPLQPFN